MCIRDRYMGMLRAHLGESEQREAGYLAEIAAYERQMTQVNKRLEQADASVRDLQSAKEALSKQFGTMRQMSAGLEGTREDMQRSLAQLEYERLHLAEQVRALEREMDLQRQQLEFERTKARDLEGILTKERETQYRQHMTLQRAEEERIELLSELQRLQPRSDKPLFAGQTFRSSADESFDRLRNESDAYKRSVAEAGLSSHQLRDCLLYTSPSPRDRQKSRMPSSA
eukprot:TRINITY_DN936_c0_g2_i8.p1 TRINITY_DN936_c0_g2~~TRINITY_DN936_c0_g2_i8.p1  ORF type:complete len:251 (-),score=80.30 TRINITY_DN936_c0_g2_i8:20-703(-)